MILFLAISILIAGLAGCGSNDTVPTGKNDTPDMKSKRPVKKGDD